LFTLKKYCAKNNLVSWYIEKEFAWLNRYRGLTKACEYLTETSETTIRTAMIGMTLHRLPEPAKKACHSG
jgi:hypothetical protein